MISSSVAVTRKPLSASSLLRVPNEGAADIDNLAVRKQARLAISHVADGNATAYHSVSKLSCRRSCQPLVHRSAFIGFEMAETKPIGVAPPA